MHLHMMPPPERHLELVVGFWFDLYLFPYQMMFGVRARSVLHEARPAEDHPSEMFAHAAE